MKFPFLKREAPCVSRVEHPSIDIRLFANDDVTFERDAFEQLFEFTDVARAIDDLRRSEPDFLGPDASIDRIVLTPDFHRGSGVPVGTVIAARNLVMPQATGNDICCGMRLLATDLPAELLEPHWAEIRTRLRAIFFQGQRDIPMSPRQREAVLRDGLPGLVETASDNATRGIWTRFDARAQREDLSRSHGHGHLPTSRLFGFESFVRSSGNVDGRDPQIGCVGGGNHFVEVQKVDAILDGGAARAWGVCRGTVALMIHSGSVGIGHAVGGYFMDRARQLFPKTVRAPSAGFHPLPMVGPLSARSAASRPSYDGLTRQGWSHDGLALNADAELTNEHLPLIHLVFSNLKAWINGTHHGRIEPKHLQAYLNEFVFRFNRRFYPMTSFNSVLGLAVRTVPPTYARLYSGVWQHPGGPPKAPQIEIPFQ
jgi:tRNA-splicing ligase RtcB